MIDWFDGYALEHEVKNKIKRAITIHKFVYLSLGCLYFMVFIYWAALTALKDHSYFFISSCFIMLFISILSYVLDNILISKIDCNEFLYKYEVVKGILVGGKYHHSKIITDSGYYVQREFIFIFHKGNDVILITYTNTGGFLEQLALMYNPIAYKL